MKKEIFAVTGMTCAACVAHVERAARSVLDGVPFAVSLLSGTLSVTLQDGADTEAVFKKLSAALKAEFERHFGPLTIYGNQSEQDWDWASGPWPWEKEAN